MESIRELYKIGKGPSSSHTMGPKRAAEQFAERNKTASKFQVTLYGSLAATGKGHMTNIAIMEVLEPQAPTEIIWHAEIVLDFHPNGMKFEAFEGDTLTDEWTVFSVGGGTIASSAEQIDSKRIYPQTTMSEIIEWCDHEGATFWEYVEKYEGKEIWDYLHTIWEAMKNSIENGLETEGVLPGGLGVRRKAVSYYIKSKGYNGTLNSRGKLYAYALAVSEENAAGGDIVTAPTCGSCGVLPGVLYYLYVNKEFREIRILQALATAALFGNIAKANASISGAEVGCQGEIGVACAMAAAASCQLYGGTLAQIEYAAEMALEHHLGLTCDPVCGLVQVPCIERNAIAAARALDSNIYATYSDGKHMVSYDRVVEVMKVTGQDLPSLYRETSVGGLAKDGDIRKTKKQK